MKNASLFYALALFLVSCGGSTSEEQYGDKVTLLPCDTISFPIDENTTYESRAMFQFEDDGREYLSFRTYENKGNHIHIFDIEKEDVHKTVPLFRQGPNAIPGMLGAYPMDLNHSIVTNSIRFTIVNDSGHVKYKSPPSYNSKHIREGGKWGKFCLTSFISRYHQPAIIKDSVLYFEQGQIGYPHTKESWQTSNIFASLNLRTNEMQPTRFCYPSVFEVEEVTRTWSCENGHSYDYTGEEVAVSFQQTDSIYVSSDFHHVKGYLAKSRHAPSMRPTLYNAQIDNEVRLRKEAMKFDYWHLMYDKYRKVFYRFVRHPYEFPADRNAQFDEDRGRIFSIVILNDQYEIIGETTLPGHTYNYTLCFVGKKGLYISLNNQDNPIFSEDELFFQRFELVEK